MTAGLIFTGLWTLANNKKVHYNIMILKKNQIYFFINSNSDVGSRGRKRGLNAGKFVGSSYINCSNK